MTASGRFEKSLAIALTSAAVAWTAAVFLVPVQPILRVPPLVRAVVHSVGAVVCHQRPERSFYWNRRRFPVCARCTGLYVSGTLGAVIGWTGLRRVPRYRRRILALAALPTVVTLGVEWLGLAGLSNLWRAFAALPLGGAAGWLFVRMLRSEERATTCAMIA